jgi:hypothetical protein
MAKAHVIRPTLLHTALPEDVRAKLDVFLWSEVERRVPKGAYQRFILERIQEFFSWRRESLEPYGFPQGFFITGPKAMIDTLTNRLKGGPL